MTNAVSTKANTAHRIWKSAQLYIGFHRDQKGNQRDEAKVWPPKNGNASIHADPKEQEVFLVLKSEDQAKPRDVQLKLHPDRIVVRRDAGPSWQGVVIEAGLISVQVNGAWIRIKSDGSVTQDLDGDLTHLEADGSVIKNTEFVQAQMSGDGVELSRRTETSIAAIRHDGVVSKMRDAS
jgi:hypothetical protein